ncbi:MAG: CTP-dependent riboflavin kinase [Candidatus Poseidoniaceae archaeon]|nr:CTP-dependent riboflavin kinase [Candidatus Poseidoniaceae archaeon]
MRISGVVSSGLGRAHVFMAQKHYQEQFVKLMGKTVWPGTLNLSVSQSNLINYIALRMKSGIDTLDADKQDLEDAKQISLENIESHRIRGFLRDGISFGGATAFKANFIVKGISVECSVLIPDLTRHFDVVEVISPTFLREHMDLKDGDDVELVLDSN